eukprot:3414063-Rhodomonas_salina.1
MRPERLTLSSRQERLEHTMTHAREVKSWGHVLYVVCKVLAFCRDCRSVDQFKEASLPRTATLRD